MYELKEVVIETTWQCNLSCVHCGSGCEHRPADGELSLVEWKNVLSQLSEMKVEKIVFSGGEPTLKIGFVELLLFASKLGLKVGFISNGFMPFSASLQQVIGQANLFAVGLSIDGLKDTHNKLRRQSKSWQGLMENVSLLQRLGARICAITTLNKLNYSELLQLAEFFSLVEINTWQLQLAMPAGRMREQTALLITEDDFVKICEEILRLKNLYPELDIQSADCFGLAPPDLIRSNYWSGCTAGISSMGIDACGNVMPCLSLQAGYRHENFKQKSIAEIWEYSEIFDFNRDFKIKEVIGECKNCNLLSECRGGCNSLSFAYYDRFHSSPFCFSRSFINNNQGETHEQC